MLVLGGQRAEGIHLTVSYKATLNPDKANGSHHSLYHLFPFINRLHNSSPSCSLQMDYCNFLLYNTDSSEIIQNALCPASGHQNHHKLPTPPPRCQIPSLSLKQEPSNSQLLLYNFPAIHDPTAYTYSLPQTFLYLSLLLRNFGDYTYSFAIWEIRRYWPIESKS